MSRYVFASRQASAPARSSASWRMVAQMWLVLAIALVIVPSLADARSTATPFFTATQLDLSRFLPPPPSVKSATTKAEIAEILMLQARRKPDRAERAKADADEDVSRFWEAVSATVPLDLSLPSQQFFAAILATEGAVIDPLKRLYARPRPHQTNSKIKPIVRLSTTGAWPSGHATSGWLLAIVLADMLPERREALFARAADYAESRLIAGIHHRSDLIVGRQAASLIALELQHNADFRTQLAAVRTELRTKLNLPT